MSEISFSSYSYSITMRMSVDEMTVRDKLTLLNHLLETFGFMQWAHENPIESEAFQLTWKKIMDENWNK